MFQITVLECTLSKAIFQRTVLECVFFYDVGFKDDSEPRHLPRQRVRSPPNELGINKTAHDEQNTKMQVSVMLLSDNFILNSKLKSKNNSK